MSKKGIFRKSNKDDGLSSFAQDHARESKLRVLKGLAQKTGNENSISSRRVADTTMSIGGDHTKTETQFLPSVRRS